MSGYIGNIPVPQATQTRDVFTATAGQTSFATSGYTPGFLDVYLNGVHLVNGTDYTASNGSDVVLTSGATAGDNLEVVAYTTFEVVDQSFSGNFSVDSPTFVVDAANNRVGVGTASPDYLFEAEASGGGEGASIAVTNTGADPARLRLNSGHGNWSVSNSVTIADALEFRDESANSTRAMIDSSGNVGIGTTETSLFNGVGGSAKLVVTGSDSATTVANNSNAALVIANTDDTANNLAGLHFAWQDTDNAPNYAAASIVGVLGTKVTGQYPAGQLAFLTSSATNSAPSEKMRIDSSGNLLVGTTVASVSSGAGFKIINDASNPYVGQVVTSSTAGVNSYHLYSINASAYRFYVSAAGQIFATSTSISGLSDEALKENIRQIDTGLAEIMSLQPRRFDWKNGDGQNVAGFVAQEVEQVLPELVSEYVHSVAEDGTETVRKALKMGDMLPTLVKAVQEQQAQIEELKAEVAALKGEPA